MFAPEEKEQILADCLRDPVLFLHTFLNDHFNLDIPWVHRGLLAVLTERTDFLLRYGQVRKIVTNFRHVYDDGRVRQIFHVFDSNGVRLNEEELYALDENIQAIQTKSSASGVLSWSEVEEMKVRILLDLGHFTLLMMPRGISKTAIAGLGVPLYRICYKLMRFLLYVSNAGPLAQGQIESVRKELAQNPAIIEFFGDLKPRRSDEERWSKEKIETVTGCAMQYRGKGAAIRGVNHNNFRPDIMIVDDPQDKDDVRSETVREQDKRWAFAELMPARERIADGTIIALGTYLGRGSLVDIFSRDPRWTTVKFGVKDADGDFLWPHYMDDKKYDVERESFQRAGLLSDFYREYHSEEFLDDDQLFKQEQFIYEPDASDVQICATYADLATSAKRTADFSCIITLGITEKGIIFVLDCWMKRGAREEEKLDEYFRQSLTWNSQLHGFESNGYQAVFETQLKTEMFRRGHYFEVIPVSHKTRKVDRIRGALRPRYASGYIRHRLAFPELEAQLLEFRVDDSHEHDDGPDAEAACLVLMDPTAAYNAGEDPANFHEPDIEDVVGTDCMDWAS